MKKKKVQKKRRKAEKQVQIEHFNEIQGILVLALGVLMLLSFYIKNSIGRFGMFIREASLGILGIPAFLIPPLIILYGVLLIAAYNKIDLKKKPLYVFILFALVSALIQTGSYDPEGFSGITPLKALERFYLEGAALSGGGVIGGLISLPFLVTFQVPGTIIILTALSLIDIILLTNKSIADFFRNIRSLVSKRKKARQSDETELDDLQPVIEENGDEISLRFDKPKVIDFRIEKTARELKKHQKRKEGSAKAKLLPEDDTDVSIEYIGPEESATELVIDDIKKSHSSKKSAGRRRTANKTVEEPGLQEIVIKGPAKAKKQNTKYVFPPLDLLIEEDPDTGSSRSYRSQALEGAKKLEETLLSFGVSAKVVNVTRGPTVTRYELQPSAGVKVSRIVNLSDDIALNLAAPGIRIEAPIPGKAAIGIEVPNREINMVRLREVLESAEFARHPSKIAFAAGKDISGEPVIADISKMPHLLIAGATGSGKSVCINCLIMSILYKSSPDEVKLLLIDPKVVELGVYNGIPHLLIPVVTDPKKAAGALNWAVQEMVNRYKLFAEKNVRDIKGYNALVSRTDDEPVMPQIVIIIDELADLMMVAPNEVEDAICRLAQMARAAGMHLVLATQRPSVDVITGVIKANIPSRISFAVSSQVDSRTILDMAGAEKLLGRGDMLMHPVGKPKPVRIQGANITDAEIERVVEYIKAQGDAEYDDEIIEEINSDDKPDTSDDGDNDELLPQAIDLVIDAGQASVSFIQRKFRVGYARAGRIIDQMEARGIISGHEGSKPRQVLITKQQWHEMQMAQKDE
ncbi:MAG: DNA translocase FtsK [Acetivibrionales bacterium]|nr:DNA translocase FtsK [Bacillota bacterium]NLP07435.1 DNA translocase FtsK [Clostridiaceae bacterium]HOA54962.1 DNA translocase FtsK [Clostridiales bacterium]